MEINNSFKDIKKNMHIYFGEKSRQAGLPFWSVHYLISLYHNNGQNMKELSDELVVDKAHTTRAVKTLEKLGCVLCKDDDFDKRIRRLYLTEKGENIAIKAQQDIEIWKNQLFKGFTEEEITLLNNFITKALKNTQQLIDHNNISK